MADYTLSTANAKQDAALAFCAAQASQTVAEYVQAQMARIVQRALNEKDRADAIEVSAAFLAATNLKQSQVRTTLGL